MTYALRARWLDVLFSKTFMSGLIDNLLQRFLVDPAVQTAGILVSRNFNSVGCLNLLPQRLAHPGDQMAINFIRIGSLNL
jgi:hypothetical protein